MGTRLLEELRGIESSGAGLTSSSQVNINNSNQRIMRAAK